MSAPLDIGESAKGLFRSTASGGRAFAAHHQRRKRCAAATFSASDLWKFAGYLAGEASVEQAAKWSGRLASEGGAMLDALCRKIGWQAR